MKEFAKRFYKSKAWQRVRTNIWQRDRGLCVDCLKHGRIVPAEEVHHITEISPDNIDNPTVTLNPDNLVSLCRECHKARHEGNGEPRRYFFGNDGKVEIR